MDFSKRVNTNRRLTRGNYGEKLYSRVWIIVIRVLCVVFVAGCFGAAGTLLGTFMGLLDGAPEVTLESLAFQTCDVIRAMEADAGVSLNDLKVDGGASANDVLMQMQSDFMQASVNRPVCVETTAMGAAFLAGLAIGYWKDRDELRAIRTVDRTFTPQIPSDEAQKRITGWHRAVERTRDWAVDRD